MEKNGDLTKEECLERTKARSMSRRGGSESDADSDIPISLGMAEQIFRSSPERAKMKVNFDVGSGMTVVSEERVPKDDSQLPNSPLATCESSRSGSPFCTSHQTKEKKNAAEHHQQQKVRAKEFAKKRSRSLCAPNPKVEFGPKASIMKSCLGITTIQDPSTLRLRWDSAPETVLVIKKQFDNSIVPHFKQLLHFLVAERKLTVFVEESVVEENLGHDPSFEAIKDQICVFCSAVDLANKIDLIICMGGDGTLLHASSIFQNSVPPIVSFHLGSLGFLMPFDFSTFRSDIDRTMAGDVPLVLRCRLKGVIMKRGLNAQPQTPYQNHCDPMSQRTSPQQQQQQQLQRKQSPPERAAIGKLAANGALEDVVDEENPKSEDSSEENVFDDNLGRYISVDESLSSDSSRSETPILVLNEIVIDRGLSAFISNVDLYLNGRLITRVQGDGLIISTPTGSTAYALAAGSSMVHPSVSSILITPICPHSLSFRPISVPAGVELKVMLSPEARNSAWVSFDGRNRQELSHGDVLRVTTSVHPVPSISKNDQLQDWFESLADCLHWNVRQPQKSFASNEPAIPISTSTSSLESMNNSQS